LGSKVSEHSRAALKIREKMSLPKPRPLSESSIPTTPKNPLARLKSLNEQNCDSPSVKIPASPLLTRLGYGTGVNVYLMKRGPKEGVPRSPWAVKRLNQYGEKMKSTGSVIMHRCILIFAPTINVTYQPF
jgi:hypothetical protein